MESRTAISPPTPAGATWPSLVSRKNKSGCSWYFVIKVQGMVVATANPTPEKAAQMFNTITEGNMTVKSMDIPKMARPKTYVFFSPIKLATLSCTKLEKMQAEKRKND